MNDPERSLTDEERAALGALLSAVADPPDALKRLVLRPGPLPAAIRQRLVEDTGRLATTIYHALTLTDSRRTDP